MWLWYFLVILTYFLWQTFDFSLMQNKSMPQLVIKASLMKNQKSASNSNKSKKDGKDQESIQSSITPDPEYQRENNNFSIRHHKHQKSASNSNKSK